MLDWPERVVLDRDAIAAQNDRLWRLDDSVHDLRAMPATLKRTHVAGWIEALSRRPTGPRYDVRGGRIAEGTFDAMVRNLAVGTIPARQATRYGLVVRRADLRTFPTAFRVFSRRGQVDIDRFQESALFPGTPVVIAHESRDHQWWFVVSPRYAAWIPKRDVAEGSAAQVFGYVDKTPYRVITGPAERTVFTRETPAVSKIQLDMGVRVPLADWPADRPVNGQIPSGSYVVDLPLRDDHGRLRFTPALLPRSRDTADDYLPLTRANLIRQSFKFLGERYGWGDMYDARDCSSFVSDVYRSMGVELPRNTGDQEASPALEHRLFTSADDAATRRAAVRKLQVGDLVYIPGHVMMVIGHRDGQPYVIHDTNGGSYLSADGGLRQAGFNGVVVTPLVPMMADGRKSYVDEITSIVTIRR